MNVNSCHEVRSQPKRVITKPRSLVLDRISIYFFPFGYQKFFLKDFESKISELDNKIKDLGDEIYELYGNFKNFYDEHENLGQGVSAIVKRCMSKATRKEFAVKIVNTKGDEELELLVLIGI